VGADSAFGNVLRRADYEWQAWQARIASDRSPSSWELWLSQTEMVDGLRNGGMAGTTDDSMYAAALRYVDRHGGPAVARDVLDFRHGLATWNFVEASQAADRLLPVVRREHRWIDGDDFRDGAVMAKLQTGDVAAARVLLDSLASLSTRPRDDLRSRLLEAYVVKAESARALTRR
jgi:hypothetical protein